MNMGKQNSKEASTIMKILKGVLLSILIIEAVAFVLMFGCGAFFFFGSIIGGYIVPLFKGGTVGIDFNDYEGIPFALGGLSLFISFVSGFVVHKAFKMQKGNNPVFNVYSILSVLILVGIIIYSIYTY
jgi:hypothetical protein